MMLLVTFQIINMGGRYCNLICKSLTELQRIYEKEKIIYFEIIYYRYINAFLIVKHRIVVYPRVNVSKLSGNWVYS